MGWILKKKKIDLSFLFFTLTDNIMDWIFNDYRSRREEYLFDSNSAQTKVYVTICLLFFPLSIPQDYPSLAHPVTKVRARPYGFYIELNMNKNR